MARVVVKCMAQCAVCVFGTSRHFSPFCDTRRRPSILYSRPYSCRMTPRRKLLLYGTVPSMSNTRRPWERGAVYLPPVCIFVCLHVMTVYTDLWHDHKDEHVGTPIFDIVVGRLTLILSVIGWEIVAIFIVDFAFKLKSKFLISLSEGNSRISFPSHFCTSLSLWAANMMEHHC